MRVIVAVVLVAIVAGAHSADEASILQNLSTQIQALAASTKVAAPSSPTGLADMAEAACVAQSNCGQADSAPCFSVCQSSPAPGGESTLTKHMCTPYANTACLNTFCFGELTKNPPGDATSVFTVKREVVIEAQPSASAGEADGDGASYAAIKYKAEESNSNQDTKSLVRTVQSEVGTVEDVKKWVEAQSVTKGHAELDEIDENSAEAGEKDLLARDLAKTVLSLEKEAATRKHLRSSAKTELSEIANDIKGVEGETNMEENGTQEAPKAGAESQKKETSPKPQSKETPPQPESKSEGPEVAEVDVLVDN